MTRIQEILANDLMDSLTKEEMFAAVQARGIDASTMSRKQLAIAMVKGKILATDTTRKTNR